MSETETNPADLGALIETYHPIDKQGCIGEVIMIGAFYIIMLVGISFVILMTGIKPKVQLTCIHGGAFMLLSGGATLFMVFWIGFREIIFTLKANKRGFKVEVYENGFTLFDQGQAHTYHWHDIRKLEFVRVPSEYDPNYLWIEDRNRVRMNIKSHDIMRFAGCSDLLIKRWKAAHGTPLPEKTYSPLMRWLRRLFGWV